MSESYRDKIRNTLAEVERVACCYGKDTDDAQLCRAVLSSVRIMINTLHLRQAFWDTWHESVLLTEQQDGSAIAEYVYPNDEEPYKTEYYGYYDHAESVLSERFGDKE